MACVEVDFRIRRYRARFCITTPKLTLASGATAHGSAWRALKLTLASGATALGSAWRALKLTLASGATALGSAWPVPLIYQTEPLPKPAFLTQSRNDLKNGLRVDRLSTHSKTIRGRQSRVGKGGLPRLRQCKNAATSKRSTALSLLSLLLPLSGYCRLPIRFRSTSRLFAAS
jgi:hypothetical protein